MKSFKLKKHQIDQLFDPFIDKKTRLVAPSVNSLGQVDFNVIHEKQEIVWNALIPLKPPKSFLFPASNSLVQFDEKNPVKLKSDHENPIAQQMIFGLKPCDLAAIKYMDNFFTTDIADHDYLARREKTMIVGVACENPSNACFCTTMEVDPGNSSMADIFIVPTGEDLYMECLTEKGEELIAGLSKGWKEASPEEIKKRKEEISQTTSSKLIEHIDMTKAKGQLENVYDHAFWSKYSEPCIVCGACTFDCPTCSCFDMNDHLSSISRGCRYRSWDSCAFNDFTLHASGHNPRSSKVHRLRQRILHKYQYTIEKMNTYSCTGCGRCIRVCPAGINTRSILKDAKEALNESGN